MDLLALERDIKIGGGKENGDTIEGDQVRKEASGQEAGKEAEFGSPEAPAVFEVGRLRADLATNVLTRARARHLIGGETKMANKSKAIKSGKKLASGKKLEKKQTLSQQHTLKTV
jgi:hypothetical protein